MAVLEWLAVREALEEDRESKSESKISLKSDSIDISVIENALIVCTVTITTNMTLQCNILAHSLIRTLRV